MKIGFLLSILLLAALIVAQEDDDMMNDSEMDDDDDEEVEMMSMEAMDPMKMPDNRNDTMIGMDRRKKNKGLKDVYMALMMVKSLIGTFLSFVSPVMQVKGFGLSVINTLVNVARFILDMRRMVPMIRNAMSGWTHRIDKPHPTVQANRKTISVQDHGGPYKYYQHQFSPDRTGFPPYIRPLSSIYLPATTYAPHRSPFRHYYTRYNKDLTTPTSQWSQHDDSNNFIRKSFDINDHSTLSSQTVPSSTP